jgi:transcription antitermination factor NusG
MQNLPTIECGAIGTTAVSTAPWFAVYTRHQHERKVASRLAEQELESFFPTYVELHRWKDRRKEVSMPLFPGYVFFRGSLERRMQILSVPGVHFIVSAGQSPAAIPDCEIDALRRAMHHHLPLEPFPFLNQGDRVRVIHGPLSGVEGLLVRKKDLMRLVLSVEILGRSAAVEIAVCDVKRCGASIASQTVAAWSQMAGEMTEKLTVKRVVWLRKRENPRHRLQPVPYGPH